MKKMNFTESFDPIAALKQSLKEDGQPAYEPYVKDGIVQIHDGRTVMVPKVHLDGNAYRNWFLHAYPNGRINVKRHTNPPLLKEDGTLVYPQEVFEIEFFVDKNDQYPKASGFGRAAYEPNNEFDEMSTAITNAYKNGMRNMGFGVDIDMDAVLESLPKYVDSFVAGRMADFVPIQNPTPYIPSTPQVTGSSQPQETVPVSVAMEPLPQVQMQVAPQQPVTPQMTPVTKSVAAPQPTPTAGEMATGNDILAHIAQNNSNVAVTEVPAPKAEPPVVVKTEDPVAETPEESPLFASLEEALNVIVEVLPGATPAYQAMAGKKIGDLDAKNLNYLGKPSLKNWENRISVNTRNAAVFVVQNGGN